MSYGPLVQFTLYGCSKDILFDLGNIYEFLEFLPERLEMEALGLPHVVPFLNCKPEEAGITGFQLISTSHLAVHTYGNLGIAFVTIFSCKEFNAKEAQEYVEFCFSPERVVVQGLDVGEDFPRKQ